MNYNFLGQILIKYQLRIRYDFFNSKRSINKVLGHDFQKITIIKLRDHKICHSEAAWYKTNILK